MTESLIDKMHLAAALRSATALGPAAGLAALSPLLAMHISPTVRAKAHFESLNFAVSLNKSDVLRTVCQSWSLHPRSKEDTAHFEDIVKACEHLRQNSFSKMALVLAEAEHTRRSTAKSHYLIARCGSRGDAALWFRKALTLSESAELSSACKAHLHLLTDTTFPMTEITLISLPLRLQVIEKALRSGSRYRVLNAMTALHDISEKHETLRDRIVPILVDFLDRRGPKGIDEATGALLMNTFSELLSGWKLETTTQHLSNLVALDTMRYDDVMRSAYQQNPDIFLRSKAALASGTAGPRPDTSLGHWLALQILFGEPAQRRRFARELLTELEQSSKQVTPAMWTATRMLLGLEHADATHLLHVLLQRISTPPFGWLEFAGHPALSADKRLDFYSRAVRSKEPGAKGQCVAFAEALARRYLVEGTPAAALETLQRVEELIG